MMSIELNAGFIRLLSRIPFCPDSHGGCVPNQPVCPDKIQVFLRQERYELSDKRNSDYHERYILIINFGTRGTVSVDGISHDFRPGQAILIMPYQFHFYPWLEDVCLHWLFFSFDCARGHSLEVLRQRPVPWPQELTGRLEEMVKMTLEPEFRFDGINNRFCQEAGMILTHLRDNGSRHAGRRHSASSVGFPTPLLDAVNRRILKGDTVLSVPAKELARSVGLSESQLRQKFQRLTGVSLGRYQRGIQMSRACQCLKNTELSISEIASRCGFESIYSFSRAFKVTQGISPLSYRRGRQKSVNKEKSLPVSERRKKGRGRSI